MLKDNKYNLSASPKNKSKVRSKRPLLLVVTGLILLAGVLLILDRKNVIDLPFIGNDKPAATTTDGINYEPATKQEKDETEKFKESLSDKTNPDTAATPPVSPTTGKKTVSPVMTSWAATPNVEVRGYVPGINEEGGTCTLTLTKDGQTVTESKSGVSDVSTTSCGLITIVQSRLSAGKWAATLSYSSSRSDGTSTSNMVEVK